MCTPEGSHLQSTLASQLIDYQPHFQALSLIPGHSSHTISKVYLTSNAISVHDKLGTGLIIYHSKVDKIRRK